MNEKLKKYLATSAGILATGIAAEASIIYTDIPDVTLSGTASSSYDIDLDGNSVTDFTLNHRGFTSSTSSIFFAYYSAGISGNGANAVVFNPGYGVPSAGPLTLNNGYSIGSSLGFGTWSTWNSYAFANMMIYSYSSGALGTNVGADFGNWRGANGKYLGVRFAIGGNTHYGWIRATVASNGSSLTIQSYAYEDCPDASILAGATTGGSNCGGCTTTYSSTNVTTCSNYTWPVTGMTYATSGIYTDTLPNAGGCDSILTLNLTVSSNLNVVTSGNTSICAGSGTTLTASGATSYSWSNGAGSGSSVTVFPTTTTTYTVIGSSSGCPNDTAQVTVTVNPVPTVSASGATTICAGQSATLTATGATSYSWSNGAGSGASVSVSPSTTTTYTVTGTTAGCSSTSQVTVTVNPAPSVIASADVTICEGESTTLSASGATSYTWNNGAGSGGSVTVSPAVTTTYTVTGTNAGCATTSNDLVTVTVQEAPEKPIISDDSFGTLSTDLTYPGYQWYLNGTAIAGETAFFITYWDFELNDINGLYKVEVFGSNGCSTLSDGYRIGPLGIHDDFAKRITIAPNPTSGRLGIALSGSFEYTISDITGRQIHTASSMHTEMVDLSEAPAGVYLLRVEQGNNKAIFKIIKE